MTAVTGGLLAAAFDTRLALAQDNAVQSLTGPMDASSHRPVRLPPREGASAGLDDAGVRQLELGLKCQCPCSLDVYTCRTTDKSCPVSPAMHRDVMALVAGGYAASEIVDAFVDVYGERARMAPKAEGFNLIAYAAPFLALAAGVWFVAAWVTRSIRRQRRTGETPALAVSGNATESELQRIEAAIKDDSL